MSYLKIHHTQYGDPYVIEKNFGYGGRGSTHWTWHISERGVKYLSKDFFGRPSELPSQISREQFEDLKAYNMLTRADGTSLGHNAIYPSDSQRSKVRPETVHFTHEEPKGIEKFDELLDLIEQELAEPVPERIKRQTFWGWLKNIFKRKRSSKIRLSARKAAKYNYDAPTGTLSEKMQRLRELSEPNSASELIELVSALGDPQDGVTYMAAGFLVKLPSMATVNAIKAYLDRSPGNKAAEQCYKVLKQIAERANADSVQRAARHILDTFS